MQNKRVEPTSEFTQFFGVDIELFVFTHIE